ncbi:phosphatidylinositol-glycan biosynthesis class S protein-domain-containing protein [Cantharellus anzutake]|uniref:phosphatidylinositol-glycan biosynthesis class S protein-domain-containing protein n=1 Tax=Cantharellus anzutake TaxID=1750568 RepID=UPI0019041454|nr:phosphatidylinositol-glycan biosynthesis class S protein-domain-containing protein [Cantharellus anzutake]KAF8321922.1 phosphatidylinositol-glycan biosynthesis class S protein-domain-containing protein [Cantharellus anzutake]
MDEDEAANKLLEEQQTPTRRIVILSYWIIIFVSVPLWWYTTRIERLPLAESQVHDETARKIVFPVSACSKGPPQARPVMAQLADLLEREPFPDSVNFTWLTEYDATHYTLSILPSHAGGPEIFVRGRELTSKVPLDVPSQSTDAVIRALKSLINPLSPPVKAQYSPTYRLAFSLLNEDSSLGGFAMAWDIEAAITRHLRRSLRELSMIYKFTIESQVQYHAPLAFEPHIVTTMMDDNASAPSYHLDQDHIKTFVNSEEWTLASTINNDVVLHFLLFIPSVGHRPMKVIKTNGTPSSANAFVIPQWGGIVIMNPPATLQNSTGYILSVEDLLQPFTLFRSQLYALLGVPELPPVLNSADDPFTLSQWQIDYLVRTRALENVKHSQEALESIVKLVHQIQGMPVKADVQKYVMNSLDYLEKAHSSSSALSILQNSIQALTLSSRAFFNPGMLAMLYFPPEHKYAVYTPLFAPISAPILVATIKELISVSRAPRGIEPGRKALK